MTIGGRMGDQVGGDGAAGARTVFDHDGPLQPLAQPLRQEPRQQVGGRADAEAADDVDQASTARAPGQQRFATGPTRNQGR